MIEQAEDIGLKRYTIDVLTLSEMPGLLLLFERLDNTTLERVVAAARVIQDARREPAVAVQDEEC